MFSKAFVLRKKKNTDSFPTLPVQPHTLQIFCHDRMLQDLKARSTYSHKETTYSTYFLILQSEADQNVIQQTATSAEVG